MDSLETIKAAHQVVWSARKELSEVWSSPCATDSLRFACTEVAEAMDALLRLNPVYKRNRNKDTDVKGEIGQVAMMLLTALGEEFDWSEWDENNVGYWETSYDMAGQNGYRGTRIDWIHMLVAEALQDNLWSEEWNAEYVTLHALTHISLEVDLVAGLKVELEKIRVKRLASVT